MLDADATLRFPDFRAEERTFALVAQLAGRSGRGERGGRVIVQALDPDAPRARASPPRHDSDGFLADELAPPRGCSATRRYGHLIRVVCSSTRAGPELEAAAARSASASRPPACPLLGPAPLFRRQAPHRAQLVVRSRRARAARSRAVREAVEAVAATREHARRGFAVDVDPQ